MTERNDKMGGLEKITEQIIKKANDEAELIINDAKEKALAISNESKKEINELFKNNQNIIKNDCEKIMSMAQSQDRQRERSELLKARSEVIETIISDAKKAITEMEKDKYKEVLLKILKNSMTESEGEIIFSKNDIKLVDDDFIKKIKDLSKGKLTVLKETQNIENGFIIRYGKIEQNCSIESIFEEKHNELTDLVNDFLMTE